MLTQIVRSRKAEGANPRRDPRSLRTTASMGHMSQHSKSASGSASCKPPFLASMLEQVDHDHIGFPETSAARSFPQNPSKQIALVFQLAKVRKADCSELG